MQQIYKNDLFINSDLNQLVAVWYGLELFAPMCCVVCLENFHRVETIFVALPKFKIKAD